MKPLFVLVAFSLSFSSFQFLNAVYGPAGMLAREHNNKEILALRENLDSLNRTASLLSNDLERLNHDPDRLRQEAYRLGMLGSGDIQVRLEQKNAMNFSYSPGKLLVRTKAELPPPELLLGISISLGVVSLFLLSFFSYEFSMISGNKGGRKNQGMRVHTASLE